jgi:hypothetical protein
MCRQKSLSARSFWFIELFSFIALVTIFSETTDDAHIDDEEEEEEKGSKKCHDQG